MFGKLKAKSSSKNGLGAITAKVCLSFIEGHCSRCRESIPNPAIFGNAWVISDSSVELLCAECRNIEGARRVDSKHYDRAAIFNIAKEIEAKDSSAWLRLIFACRAAGNLLNNVSPYQREAFDVKLTYSAEDEVMADDIVYQLESRKPVSELYGSTKLIHRCGECGHSAKDNLGYQVDVPRCRNCFFPDHAQWNMRTTFEEEIKRAKSVRF